MTKVIKMIFIFGLLSFIIACNGNGVTTNEAANMTTIETTESSTTNIPETTNTQTITDTTISTEHISDFTTSEPSTSETTTSVPITTEVPTTVASTTQVTTTEWVTIYFENVANATSIDALSNIPGNSFTMPDDPIRPGYIFGGWFQDESLTIPFTITVYPDEDMTVYAKWTEETNPADLIMDALESGYDFVCNNNICVYEQYSWLTYTFNFNDFTFKQELIDDDASDNQTKHEVVTIDEDWNVSYSFSIQYLSSTASMTVSGDAVADTYNINSFSSNPTNYLTETNVYNDAIDFISDAVIFLELIVDNLEIDYNDLN